MFSAFMQLCCPLDQTTLEFAQGTWRCPHGHCFDRAKQGYVNLLPAQFKNSRQPGDDKAMVNARRYFLEQGYYQPIAQALCETIHEYGAHKSADSITVLDAGCGEGYYLRQLEQHVTAQVVGLDISKWAITAAASQQKHVQFVVASNARIPLPDSSMDIVLCLFGFPVLQEFTRILRPGGRLITIDAGPLHLIELRRYLYPEIKDAPAPAEEATRLHYPIHLQCRTHIDALIDMTPHRHRASKTALEVFSQQTQLHDCVDVLIQSVCLKLS